MRASPGSGHRETTEEKADQRIHGKEIRRRNLDGGVQVLLQDEDGGDGTRQNWVDTSSSVLSLGATRHKTSQCV